jgi:hypothetical protein
MDVPRVSDALKVWALMPTPRTASLASIWSSIPFMSCREGIGLELFCSNVMASARASRVRQSWACFQPSFFCVVQIQQSYPGNVRHFGLPSVYVP